MCCIESNDLTTPTGMGRVIRDAKRTCRIQGFIADEDTAIERQV